MTRPRSKAANSDGSIWSRPKKDGTLTWFVEISDGYYPSGKRKRIRRTAATQAAARKLRHELLHQQQQGLLTTKSNETVRSLGHKWVTEVKPLSIRASTASDYRYRLERYVYPHLGSVLMTELSPQHIYGWISRLKNQGYSTRTINVARTILHQLCKYSTRIGLIPYNPVVATDPVRASSGKTQVRPPWSHEEVNKVLIASLDDPRLDCFLHLLLHTGMRSGEALGLRWEDIDEVMNQLHITGTLKAERRISGSGQALVRLTRNDPKTASSRRSLDISDALRAALDRQRDHQARWRADAGSAWVQSGYVITTQEGTPFSDSNLRKRYIRFLGEIGVRYIRIHDLRHTVARLALDVGVPLEHLSQALGHTRIDTTKQIYAGYVPRYTQDFVHVYSATLPEPPSSIPDTVQELQHLWEPRLK
jgi:integrase